MTNRPTPVRQGQIPGADYTISKWTIQALRQWLQNNLAGLLPSSLQVKDVQSETVTVNTRITLSTAALSDLKKQLGL